MKFLITILAVLVIQIVDAVEEEGDVNIVIKQHVVMPDVDECLEKIDACADTEVCVNLPGTYRCACADGFEKVKGICKDIDECIENCGTYGVCVNSPGSFTCTCNEGFEEVEGICKDIDECIENCGTYGVCVNSPGSFTCTCNEGFEEVEGICKDIDECEGGSNSLCGVAEKCINNIGNYTCSCSDEYSRVKGICEECVHPSKFHVELGCITPVAMTTRTFDDAITYCKDEGKRLIEGIKRKHKVFLENNFAKYNYAFWIGLKDSHWITSKEEVPQDDEIWIPNRAIVDGAIYGAVVLESLSTDFGLDELEGTLAQPALCQSLQ